MPGLPYSTPSLMLEVRKQGQLLRLEWRTDAEKQVSAVGSTGSTAARMQPPPRAAIVRHSSHSAPRRTCWSLPLVPVPLEWPAPSKGISSHCCSNCSARSPYRVGPRRFSGRRVVVVGLQWTDALSIIRPTRLRRQQAIGGGVRCPRPCDILAMLMLLAEPELARRLAAAAAWTAAAAAACAESARFVAGTAAAAAAKGSDTVVHSVAARPGAELLVASPAHQCSVRVWCRS